MDGGVVDGEGGAGEGEHVAVVDRGVGAAAGEGAQAAVGREANRSPRWSVRRPPSAMRQKLASMSKRPRERSSAAEEAAKSRESAWSSWCESSSSSGFRGRGSRGGRNLAALAVEVTRRPTPSWAAAGRSCPAGWRRRVDAAKRRSSTALAEKGGQHREKSGISSTAPSRGEHVVRHHVQDRGGGEQVGERLVEDVPAAEQAVGGVEGDEGDGREDAAAGGGAECVEAVDCSRLQSTRRVVASRRTRARGSARARRARKSSADELAEGMAGAGGEPDRGVGVGDHLGELGGEGLGGGSLLRAASSSSISFAVRRSPAGSDSE